MGLPSHSGLHPIISEGHSVLATISLCTLWIALGGDWSNLAGSRRKQKVYVDRYIHTYVRTSLSFNVTLGLSDMVISSTA